MKEWFNKLISYFKGLGKKKLIILLTSVVLGLAAILGLILGLGALKDGKPTPPTVEDYYEISVKLFDEAPVPNVTVALYRNNAVFKTGVTNANGKALIAAPAGTYQVGVSNMPLGYAQLSKVCETDNKFTPLTVVVSQGIPAGVTAPAGHHYAEGNTLYDFSVETNDGTTFTISEVLETKKMVLLNFWATWCTYCIGEFPALNEAYQEYSDDVAVIALSTTDTQKKVNEFASENNFAFPMAADTDAIFNMFAPPGDTGIPVSVIIDRYGVMAYYHKGALTEKKDFTRLFDKYISDEYRPEYAPIIGGNGEDPEYVLEYAKPTEGLVMPESSEIENAINNTASGFNFSYYPENGKDKDISWPWLVNDDNQSISPSNIDNHYSFATIYTDVTLKAGDVIAFDYLINSEDVYDLLYVQIDGMITHELHGNLGPSYKTCYAYVAQTDGTYTLDLLYYKDTETHATDETVRIKNMRICSIDDIDVPTDIRRYAADFPVENRPEGSTSPRYTFYADVALNTDDGYYHLLADNGTPTGPLLMADLLHTTQWSYNSVYQYYVEGMCIFNNVDFSPIFEAYSWIANNALPTYAPVTEELRIILEMLTEKYGVGYENEWLEICVYYDHFGGGTPIQDPARGVHFKTAIPLTMPENETQVTFNVNIDRLLVPRGFKYAFTPTVSGIYHLQSLVPVEQASKCDPMVWLFNSEETLLDEHNSIIGAYYPNSTTPDNNFSMFKYLEKGETYYFAIGDFDVNFIGSYTVMLSYLGESYQYLTTCAEIPFTYDESGNIYLPGAIETGIDDDGYVRQINRDGSFGSYIYLNIATETSLMAGRSIAWMLENYEQKGYGANNPPPIASDEEPHFNFSVMQQANGSFLSDCTEKMKAYAAAANDPNNQLPGFVKVDEELLAILKIFTSIYSFAEADDAWQAMCYYYKTLDASL